MSPTAEVITSSLPLKNRSARELKHDFRTRALTLKTVTQSSECRAGSAPSLRAYILADAALMRGQLTRRQRNQVAVAVARINSFSPGFSAGHIADRSQGSEHPVTQAAGNPARAETILRFTQALVLHHGEISNCDLQALGKAGFSDSQIAEIVANIALNVFSVFFNAVAQDQADVSLATPEDRIPNAATIEE